jgi:hypothetical protein
MRHVHVGNHAWLLLALSPAIGVSHSRPDPLPQRSGIRLRVDVQNTTLPATVRLRFLGGADSLDGAGRVVSVPYDRTFPVQQLRVRVEPTDPGATVRVLVERWNDGNVADQGGVTGKGACVQVQRDAIALATGRTPSSICPVQVHVF